MKKFFVYLCTSFLFLGGWSFVKFGVVFSGLQRSDKNKPVQD